MPALQGAVHVDVAIVGGGITGITAAYLLKQAGKRVAVIEAHRVGAGVTGETTAHISALLDTRYYNIESDFGKDGAKLAAQSQNEAIEQIAHIVRDLQIECDFTRVPVYLYTEQPQAVDEIKQEIEAARRAGLNAAYTEQIPLPFSTKGALWLPDQAQFHPLRYLFQVAAAIPGGGSHIFEHSRIQDIQDGSPCQVKTEEGSVTADTVIMATNVPPGLHVVDTEVAPYRSYVMALRTDDIIPEGLYWDTEDPYHYIRWANTGGGRVLLVGGYDHKVGQNDDTESAYRALYEYAQRHFQVNAVVGRWSGQTYEPADSLAYIGLSPGAEHVYLATGYGGLGMTYSNVAARLLTDLIMGRPNPYADLYSPARIKPLASAVDFVRENVNVMKRFVGDRLSSEVDSFADIPTGEGRIVGSANAQIAAYRDESGELHMLSPVCPHMKCIVQWNSAEKSWDCPCHGGRFTPTGDWIEGPPAHNLTPVQVKSEQSDQS